MLRISGPDGGRIQTVNLRSFVVEHATKNLSVDPTVVPAQAGTASWLFGRTAP
jgi:hypothetical protein